MTCCRYTTVSIAGRRGIEPRCPVLETRLVPDRNPSGEQNCSWADTETRSAPGFQARHPGWWITQMLRLAEYCAGKWMNRDCGIEPRCPHSKRVPSQKASRGKSAQTSDAPRLRWRARPSDQAKAWRRRAVRLSKRAGAARSHTVARVELP